MDWEWEWECVECTCMGCTCADVDACMHVQTCMLVMMMLHEQKSVCAIAVHQHIPAMHPR